MLIETLPTWVNRIRNIVPIPFGGSVLFCQTYFIGIHSTSTMATVIFAATMALGSALFTGLAFLAHLVAGTALSALGLVAGGVVIGKSPQSKERLVNY
jgi:hypothetical protein